MLRLALLLMVLAAMTLPGVSAVFGVPSLSIVRGGGLFGKGGKAEAEMEDKAPAAEGGKTYPPMSQEEVRVPGEEREASTGR